MSDRRPKHPRFGASEPPVTQRPLLEALLVDRDRLVRVLRIALAELHNRRVVTPNCTGETEIAESLRYWDEVFGWIKGQRAADIVLMSRAQS